MDLDEAFGTKTNVHAHQLVASHSQLMDDLKRMRESNGLSIDDIANLLGVPAISIARIEGERDPRLSTISPIAASALVTRPCGSRIARVQSWSVWGLTIATSWCAGRPSAPAGALGTTVATAPPSLDP